MRRTEILRRNIIKIINAKTTDDTSHPSSAQGVYTVKSARKVAVSVEVSGNSNPSWDITPLVWNTLAGKYFAGTTLTIEEGKHEFLLDIYGASDLYFDCRNKQGTSPTISIWVTDLYEMN